MEELPVAEEPRFTRGGGTEVVDFEQVSMTKVQSTSGADAALAVEEDSGPPRDIGAAAQTNSPVDPVSIERSAATLNLAMPLDCGRVVAGELWPGWWGEVPCTPITPPVLVGDPPSRLVPVPPVRPATQELVSEKVQFGEARL